MFHLCTSPRPTRFLGGRLFCEVALVSLVEIFVSAIGHVCMVIYIVFELFWLSVEFLFFRASSNLYRLRDSFNWKKSWEFFFCLDIRKLSRFIYATLRFKSHTRRRVFFFFFLSLYRLYTIKLAFDSASCNLAQRAFISSNVRDSFRLISRFAFLSNGAEFYEKEAIFFIRIKSTRRHVTIALLPLFQILRAFATPDLLKYETTRVRPPFKRRIVLTKMATLFRREFHRGIALGLIWYTATGKQSEWLVFIIQLRQVFIRQLLHNGCVSTLP